VRGVLTRWVVPVRCAGCRRQPAHLCCHCLTTLQFALPFCLICDQYSPHGLIHKTCTHLTIQHISLFYYNHVARNLLKLYKKKPYKAYAQAFNQLLKYYLHFDPFYLTQKIPNNNVSIIYPASTRSKSLGYDHIKILVPLVAQGFNIRNWKAVAAYRSKKQAKQLKTIKSKTKRAEFLLRHSYTIRPKALRPHSNILIIDDVTTTSVTLLSLVNAVINSGVPFKSITTFTFFKVRLN